MYKFLISAISFAFIIHASEPGAVDPTARAKPSLEQPAADDALIEFHPIHEVQLSEFGHPADWDRQQAYGSFDDNTSMPAQ